MKNNNDRKVDFTKRLQVLCESTDRIKLLAAYLLDADANVEQFTTCSLSREKQNEIITELSKLTYPVVVQYITELSQVVHFAFTTVHNDQNSYGGKSMPERATSVLSTGYNHIKSNNYNMFKQIQRRLNGKDYLVKGIDPNHVTKMVFIAAFRNVLEYCEIKNITQINEQENVKYYKSTPKTNAETTAIVETREDRLIEEESSFKVSDVMNITSMPISENLKLELIKEVLASIGYAVVKKVGEQSDIKFTTDLNSIMTVLNSMGYTIEKVIDNNSESPVQEMQVEPILIENKEEIKEEKREVVETMKTKAKEQVLRMIKPTFNKFEAEGKGMVTITKLMDVLLERIDFEDPNLNFRSKEFVELICDSILDDSVLDLLFNPKLNKQSKEKRKSIVKELVEVIKSESDNITRILSSAKFKDLVNFAKVNEGMIIDAFKNKRSMNSILIELMPQISEDVELLKLVMIIFTIVSKVKPILDKAIKLKLNDDDVTGYKNPPMLNKPINKPSITTTQSNKTWSGTIDNLNKVTLSTAQKCREIIERNRKMTTA